MIISHKAWPITQELREEMLMFLLTRPSGGVTVFFYETGRTYCDFYSHAPHEAWPGINIRQRPGNHFYSHVPHEAWQRKVYHAMPCYTFLLTRPSRGVTMEYVSKTGKWENFYSHAPHEAWRRTTAHLKMTTFNFYSHAPHEAWLSVFHVWQISY